MKLSKEELEAARIAQARVDADSELMVIKEKYSILESKYDRALENIDRHEQTFDFAKALDLSELKSINISTKRPSGDAQAAAIWDGADQHIHQVVEPGQVNYKNKYTIDIAWESEEAWLQNSLLLTNNHRSLSRIDTLYMVFGGDLVPGLIHDDQMESTSAAEMEQTLDGIKYAETAIDFALKKGGFKKIFVVFVIGNHSRNTKRLFKYEMVKHSYEWLVANLIAKRYKNQKNIEVMVPSGEDVYFKIFDWNIRATHSFGVKGGKGIGGIDIPLRRAIISENAKELAHLTLVHHFHHFGWGYDSGYVKCGSLMGFSPDALRYGFQEASQTLIIVDKKRGIIDAKPIFVRPQYRR